MIVNVYSFSDGRGASATIGGLVRAALCLGPRTLEEIQALLPSVHPDNVRPVLLSLIAEGVAEVYQRETPDPESSPKPDDAPAITYRDLPPDLQAVWREVFASYRAALAGIDAGSIEGDRDEAEEEAWEAVRRANGGELPAVPSRDIVAEGVEMARTKLERAVVDTARSHGYVLPLAVAVNALEVFEEQHGRRP